MGSADLNMREYLLKHFGTSKMGDCSNCKLNQSNHKLDYMNHVYELPCKQKVCVMKTKWDMHKAEMESGKDTSNKTASKVAKLNILGYTEELSPPWVFMRNADSTSYAWFNPQFRLYGTRLYSEIMQYGDIIFCTTEMKISKNGVRRKGEVFSIQCGNVDIALGIPNMTLYQDATALYRYLNKIERHPGYIVLDTKDEVSNIKGKVIVSRYGDRLIVEYDNSLNIQVISDGVYIKFPRSNHFIKTDTRLNVIKSNATFAMKI